MYRNLTSWLQMAFDAATEGAADDAAVPFEEMPEDEFRTELIEHIDSMYRLGLTLTRSSRDAEDLAQEALMRALAKFRQFRANTNMRAWLLAIVRNAFINRYRRQRKAPGSVDFDGVASFIADKRVHDDGQGLSVRNIGELARIEEQLDGELKRALDELSEGFRETFLLAVVEELSYKDIAVILDVPVGTVMSRLFRARRQMASRLSSHALASGWLREDPADSGDNGSSVEEADNAPDSAGTESDRETSGPD